MNLSTSQSLALSLRSPAPRRPRPSSLAVSVSLPSSQPLHLTPTLLMTPTRKHYTDVPQVPTIVSGDLLRPRLPPAGHGGRDVTAYPDMLAESTVGSSAQGSAQEWEAAEPMPMPMPCPPRAPPPPPPQQPPQQQQQQQAQEAQLLVVHAELDGEVGTSDIEPAELETALPLPPTPALAPAPAPAPTIASGLGVGKLRALLDFEDDDLDLDLPPPLPADFEASLLQNLTENEYESELEAELPEKSEIASNEQPYDELSSPEPMPEPMPLPLPPLAPSAPASAPASTHESAHESESTHESEPQHEYEPEPEAAPAPAPAPAPGPGPDFSRSSHEPSPPATLSTTGTTTDTTDPLLTPALAPLRAPPLMLDEAYDLPSDVSDVCTFADALPPTPRDIPLRQTIDPSDIPRDLCAPAKISVVLTPATSVPDEGLAAAARDAVGAKPVTAEKMWLAVGVPHPKARRGGLVQGCTTGGTGDMVDLPDSRVRTRMGVNGRVCLYVALTKRAAQSGEAIAWWPLTHAVLSEDIGDVNRGFFRDPAIRTAFSAVPSKELRTLPDSFVAVDWPGHPMLLEWHCAQLKDSPRAIIFDEGSPFIAKLRQVLSKSG